jgi:hypothetical protein
MATVGTLATTRQAPERRFENYVFTRVVDPSAGLTDIHDTRFTQLSGSVDATGFNVGQGGCDNASSAVYQIGFNFQLDNITYIQFVANTNGWMALVDPTEGTFAASEVLSGSVAQNELIKGAFTSKAVLLAPWFDDLRNVVSSSSQLESSPTNFSFDKAQHVAFGIEPRPTLYYSQVAYGVSYCIDAKTPRGRRLIVRWNSLSNYTSPSAVLKFEVVLYENGTIEYRYVPRSVLGIQGNPSLDSSKSGGPEGATIGIFMPNGTNRFRDMALALGYREGARQEYIYGGYTYNAAYTDTLTAAQEGFPASAPYSIGLRPAQNWPGNQTGGCTFTMSPPVNRREVLPRSAVRNKQGASLPTVLRTGDDRLGNGSSWFDDRRSATFAVPGTNLSANYPSTLPRFFGGSAPGTLQRQDLFSGDFLVTGSIVKSAADPFMAERPPSFTAAFNEGHRHEQDPATELTPYYTTGSSPNAVGEGFDKPLKSKTQVRFSLPVDVSIQMPPNSSSIYYYNARAHGWEVPSNASYALAASATTSPGGGGDWSDPSQDAAAPRTIEDARGFGPIGNIVSSGSHVPNGANDQTDASIGTLYTPANFVTAIGKEYPNSVRNANAYCPTPDELFTLPITTPFLIEKMVIEVPFAAGPGWFADLTQAFSPLQAFSVMGHSFDFAGPALTFALSRQVPLSENSPNPSRRDLILTGTVTHAADNTSAIVISNFPGISNTYQARPVGFLSYASQPGAVVTPNASNYFTGSVTIQCQALSAVGVVARLDLIIANSSSLLNYMTNAPTLSLSQVSTSIAYISPFGRAGTGFQPAGRCVLGEEFVTLQNLADQTGNTIKNPYYVGPNGLSVQQKAALSANGSYIAVTAVPLLSHYPAPYLVMPGDKLCLSVSKMRPFIYNGTAGASLFSASLQHDVNLQHGTINITLYGSLIQAGVEYHEATNESLVTDGIHELIGAEPVLDQFEPAYRNEYSGSFSDNVMLGSMLTRGPTGGPTFIAGARDRKLSKLNARNAPPLTTNVTDTAINPYKGFRLQPWWERVGNVRTSQFTSDSERFYDSMMPAIDQCLAADGCGIFTPTGGGVGIFGDVDQIVSSSLGGFFFDYAVPSVLAESYAAMIDLNWTKAYPFEQRYSRASRLLNVLQGFVASYAWDGVDAPVAIPSTPVSNLIFCEYGRGWKAIGSTPTYSYNRPAFNWYVDVNLANGLNSASMYMTSSMSSNDIARTLYGFGDFNSFISDLASDAIVGTGHFAAFRDYQRPTPSGGDVTYNNYDFSPVIRGWKYGVHSGLPTFSKCYWRHGKFGQFRDMLEQRPYTKYYDSPERGPTDPNFKQSIKDAAVNVRFVSPDGTPTDPLNTWTNNLSFEVTSSTPYIEGTSTSRPPVNLSSLNQHIVTLRSDGFKNVTL